MNRIVCILCISIFMITGCKDKEPPRTTKDFTSINTQLGYGDFKAIVYMQPPGQKLTDFLTNVGARHAPYDICYSQNPYVVPWVFHLGKVRMDIQVERHKDGYYVSKDYAPSVTFDGMSRKERMNAYYAHMGRLLKKKNVELEKLNNKYFK